MRVDNTAQVSGNRNSVRIQTQFSFTGGLVIMDSVHMPTGCGTWPAFWTDGANWPVTGEIDIVEGVNDYTNNQVTVHANTGCQLPTNNVTALGISGSIVSGTNCAALQTNNEGCGVRASQTNSFGEPFNRNGGGVYASAFLQFPTPHHVLGIANGYTPLRQCFGTTRESLFGSSRGRTSRPTSPRRHPFLRVGVHPWHPSLQVAATHSSSS